MLDLILRSARLPDRHDIVDIGIAGGRIAQIAPSIVADAPSFDAGGRLVTAGLVETHIHLDKSCLCDRCGPTSSLKQAIAAVSALKRDFTEEDVYARAGATLEKAILQGTMRMRAHVEVDPRVGLRGFAAMKRLKRDYAWAVDLQICAFAQEGLTNDPGAEELLVEACAGGADLVGGCPYTDSDPDAQIARIFAIARRFDCDVDFHLDFDLDAGWMRLDEVCRATDAAGWGGRVVIGHATKLSAAAPEAVEAAARRLAGSGVAVVALPATDLFLMGRDSDRSVPRGVAPAHRLAASGVVCAVATNNVLNPFTPFGDCSLMRMANLYANVAQLGAPQELAACFGMITRDAARMLNLRDYGVTVGGPADLVVVDAESPADAVATVAPPLLGIRKGRESFRRPAAILNPPA